MSSLSRFVACRGLVILLAMTLGVFGVRTLQAKEKGCHTNCPVQSCQTNCAAVDKHAQHEAEEAREREEKAAEHARHEAEEAREREEAKQPACNMCAPKCEPVCAPKSEPKEISIIVVEPAPQPTPEPFPQGLPKTASPMSLIGLVGVVLSLTGFGMRFRR
jgi:hypothetical protein